MLGNPVTHRPIAENDVLLCQELAAQIAVMLEHRRRYLELELQAEEMAATVQQQLSRATREFIPEAAPELLAEAVPELVGEIAPEQRIPVPEPVGQPVLQPENGAVPARADELDRYLAMFEAISEGVILSDTTGRVQLVNKAAERILGRTRRELAGQPIRAVCGQIDAEESIDHWAVAFSRRDQPLPIFIEDDERAIQGHLIPWRDDQRGWLGIIAIFKDVTPAVRADKARSDFVAALSHELQAPLTMIKGYSELITTKTMGDYSPEQVRIQQIIHGNVERMVKVLDNALKISVSDRTRFVARFEEVEVTKVIDEALRGVAPLVQGHDLNLSREIKGELPPIEANPRHLRRILENLLSNACQFTPRGGRVILRAWVQSAQEKGLTQPHLFISVADNGIGIPQKEIEKIFIPFYQVENQNVEEKGGMGLGLAVVKELVELHHGQVWVESLEGVGSMFQVALPVSREY
jgi:PAS domain S-box-containing protein